MLILLINIFLFIWHEGERGIKKKNIFKTWNGQTRSVLRLDGLNATDERQVAHFLFERVERFVVKVLVEVNCVLMRLKLHEQHVLVGRIVAHDLYGLNPAVHWS